MFNYAIAAAVLAAAVFGNSAASAQESESRQPFTGPSAGVEAGKVRREFTLDVTQPGAGGSLSGTSQQLFRSDGVGGGLFAGYDVAATRHLRLGAELGALVGGRTTSALYRDSALVVRPRFSLRGVARIGYVLTPRLLAYGSVGIGGDASRVTDTLGVKGSDDLRWRTNLVTGLGMEYRIGRRVGVRVDTRRTSGQGWQGTVGVPIRF